MSTELCARMLRENMRNAPPWFRIGLQEYVETVEIQGDLARFGHRLPRATAAVNETVQYLRSQLGEDAWIEGMHPEIPELRVLENPYKYTYAD